MITINGQTLTLADLLRLAESGEGVMRDSARFVVDYLDEASDSVALHTSGSTGEPKLIRLPKRLMQASARATLDWFGLRRGDSALLCMSPRYVAGKMMLVRALEGGLRLWVVEPSRRVTIPLEAGRIRFAAMVPLQAEASLAMPDFARIDHLIIGGGAVSPALEARLLALAAPRCYATYGMTETASHVALRPLGEAAYRALPGISFAVDERGCLTVVAPRLLDAPLQTNDVVRLLDASRFEWLGRADFVVNSGGIKLHPEQLERRLQGLIPVPFYLTKRPSRVFGEELVMVVEAPAASLCSDEASSLATVLDDTNPLAAELNRIFAEHLERYERPKAILCLPQFEYSESGKLLRRGIDNR